MSDQNRRAPRGRAFRLEFLDPRELLSGVAVSGHRAVELIPLAKVSKETIEGSLVGEGFAKPTTISTGTTSVEASGMATILGLVGSGSDFDYSISRRHKVKYTNGTGEITNSAGDGLVVSFSGSGKEESGGIFTFKVKGKATVALGTVAGGKGTFSAGGSFDSITHADSFSFKAIVPAS